ncbi:MAG: hypothetical protein JKY92_08235 [Magnetovibrio sp.]|nr:hypothetical protein [Magnetovibrio sp.]
MLTQEEESQQKEILWYQTTVDKWYQNRMEGDKQVLTLSGLGIGLLMTLNDDLTNKFSITLWIGAAICYFLAMFLILVIYKKNADYLLALIKNADVKMLGKAIGSLTKIAFGLFLFGAFLTIILAIKELPIFASAGGG